MKNSYFLRIADDGLAEIDLMQLSSWAGRHFVTRVITPAKYRSQGYMRKLMAEMLADADRESVELVLEILPSGEMTYRQLYDWYARLGFRSWKYGCLRRVPRKHGVSREGRAVILRGE